MTKKDIEGFLSNPFFIALKPKKTELDLEWFKKIFEAAFKDDSNNRMDLYNSILQKYYEINETSLTMRSEFNANYSSFVKLTLLECFLQEEVLHYFCTSQEYDKVIELINRKQINSKLLTQVLSRVSKIADALSLDIERLTLILNSNIKSKILAFNNDYVIKEMGQLKSKIDSITSGVNAKCYIDFYNSGINLSKPTDDLLSYVKEKHGYDLMHDNYEFDDDKKHLVEVLSLALSDDNNLWSFKGLNKKTIVNFIAQVEKYNGIKHAEKIINYAFNEVCKDKKFKLLYDNKLSFGLYDIEHDLINWSLNRLEVYLSKVVDFKIEESELNGFIYPINGQYEKCIAEGEKIFKNFIKNVYPNDYDKVLKVFSNLDYIIQEEQTEKWNNKALTIRDVLDYQVLGFKDVDEKKKLLTVSSETFFNDESVLKRMYYRIYIINKYAKELSNECIYEYLYEILKVMEKNSDIKSSYVLDTNLRDTNYLLLKGILSKYNIQIDDKYKPLYINALLDRKYATAEETSRFAELEQFGDAIYELAVDNVLFYNPLQYNALNHESRENYVKADSQVEVVKNIGLDKAYISRLNNALNNKYHQHEYIEAGLNLDSLGNHYLADALEMVIGVVVKEFGIQRALDFATDIITDTFNMSKPVIFKNFDPAYLYNESNIDKDYLNKIYPGPFLKEQEYYMDYSTISYALNKILKIAIIGNDTIEKRKLITYTLNELVPGDRYGDCYQVVVTYLYYGIEETINKYRGLVESNYEQNNK